MCVLLISGFAFGQLRNAVDPQNNNLAALATFGPDGANIGTSSTVINPPKNIKGSFHLFKTWNNIAVLTVLNYEKKLLLKNINYNIDRDVFESRINKDSVFVFNFENIEGITINSREFQYLYFPAVRGNKTFEVVYDGGDFSILKEYYMYLVEGSDNPQVNRPSKYVQKSKYYIRRNNSFKTFKLKKKNILEIVGDRASDLEAYVEENKLSYKKDSDVKQMLTNFLN